MNERDVKTGIQAMEPAGGFEALEKSEVGEAVAVAAIESELQASVAMAVRFPRDEERAYGRMMKSCERKSFADVAVYRFPRGGKEVTGPSVNLAREAGRHWGNTRWGLRILSDDDQYVHIQGYAIDLEANNTVTMDDKFKKLIYRKAGGWQVPDERDLRELINRRGAICVRNALLQVIPSDIVAMMEERCNKTRVLDASKDLEKARKAILASFAELGVTEDELSAYLDHSMRAVTAEEVADLRGVYKSIKDGVSKKQEYFGRPSVIEPTPVATGTVTDRVHPGRPDVVKP